MSKSWPTWLAPFHSDRKDVVLIQTHPEHRETRNPRAISVPKKGNCHSFHPKTVPMDRVIPEELFQEPYTDLPKGL